MRSQRFVVLGLLFVLAVAGCAKNKNDKNLVSTTEYVEKSVFQTADGKPKLYAFTKTIMGANEELSSDYMIPGFHHDFGFVNVYITEKELIIRRTGEANRPDEKATVVASYPILQHFDIKRAENDFNEQTNQIIEDERSPWYQRKYMRVDWGSNTATPSELTTIFATTVAESGGKVVSPLKVESGLVSFETDVSIIQIDRYAMGSNEYDYDQYGYRARIKNSLLEVKNSDFASYEMKNKDFARFGFFRSYENIIDPNTGPLLSKVKQYANRFNVCEVSAQTAGKSCQTNKIPFYINKGFNYEFIEPTRESIRQWNKAFQKALNRTDTVVELIEEEKDIGDTRYNMVAVIDENVPTGLLGVSQTVNNPHSGETLMARSTIYLGAVRYYGKDAGDRFDVLSGTPPPGWTKSDLLEAAPEVTHKLLAKDLPKRILARQSLLNTKGYKNFPSNLKRPTAQAAKTFKALASKPAEVVVAARHTLIDQLAPKLASQDPAWSAINKDGQGREALEQMKGLAKIDRVLKKEKFRELARAERGIHKNELVDPAVEQFIRKFVIEHQGEPPAQVRSQLVAEVRRLVFYTTLLHEMGHNFGLRHNFAGSADDNHYTDQYYDLERQKQALDPNDPNYATKLTFLTLEQESYDYSSVMDYAGGFHEAIGGVGQYDVAAIRFGYNQSIDRNGDPVTGINQRYLFCTDHMVQEDILCQRWDKGSTVNDAFSRLIADYNRDYVWRQFRRDRLNFGNPMNHFYRVLMNTMFPLRQAVDEFLYQFIMSPSEAGGPCDIKYLNDSIRKGEMANICDGRVMDQYAKAFGVDFSDWGQFVLLLLKPDGSGFLKDPSEYIPSGFADLMLSSEMVTGFFQDVIGMTDPGLYLAQEGKEVHFLERLPRMAQGSDEDALKFYYMNQGATEEQASSLVDRNKGNLVSLKPGPQSKYLQSFISMDGNFRYVDAIGYEFDKLAAILIMGARGLPVEKYWDISLNANMYFAPQTKTATTALYNSIINEAEYVSVQKVVTKGNKVIDAAVPAAWNLTTRVYGLFFAAADLVSDQNSEFADKLKICAKGEAGCEGNSGNEVASFKSQNGGVTFRAAQVASKDSIVFPLVKQGEKLSIDRDQALADLQNLPALRAEMPGLLNGQPTDSPATRQTKFMQLVKSKAPQIRTQLQGIYGSGNPLPGSGNDLHLWQFIMDMGKNLNTAQPWPQYALVIKNGYLPDELSRGRALIELNVQDAGVKAELLAAEATVAKDMVEVNKLTARILASDLIEADATEKLRPIEDDVKFVRLVFRILGIE
ncbi:MAG: hypothetical protein IT289_03850 [Oligoflexia bacterium]|nr:hypothetical protein [Oligoflexia bacterium]